MFKSIAGLPNTETICTTKVVQTQTGPAAADDIFNVIGNVEHRAESVPVVFHFVFFQINM